MESQNTAPEKPLQNFLAPGADSETFRVRPGNVPESDDRRVRQFVPDQFREQGEMVILYQDDRIVGGGFFSDGLSESFVNRHIVVPIRRAERGPYMGDVTQGPETFVRKPVVVTGLLFRGYPDAANLIRGMLRRHTHMAARVHDIPIGRSVAMCDPHPGTGTHDRLQRRD